MQKPDLTTQALLWGFGPALVILGCCFVAAMAMHPWEEKRAPPTKPDHLDTPQIRGIIGACDK